MADNNDLLEALRQLRLTIDKTRPLDSPKIPSEENVEELDEPFLDDRNIEPDSLKGLFEKFEYESTGKMGLEPTVLDQLNSFIPNADTDAETFENFFNSLGIQHFKADELLRMGGSNASGPCAGKNKIPAKSLWPNIVPTIQALDLVRSRLGYAINTTSVYRHKDYNDCLREHSSGVARYSKHMEFRAIDFQGVSGSPSEWHAAVVAISASRPEFGIWTRKYSTFVHIDTRGAA